MDIESLLCNMAFVKRNWGFILWTQIKYFVTAGIKSKIATSSQIPVCSICTCLSRDGKILLYCLVVLFHRKGQQSLRRQHRWLHSLLNSFPSQINPGDDFLLQLQSSPILHITLSVLVQLENIMPHPESSLATHTPPQVLVAPISRDFSCQD